MSEAEPLSKGPEHKLAAIDASLESINNLERIRKAADNVETDSLKSQLESLQSRAESHAISGKELNVGDTNTENNHQEFGISKKLRSDTYSHSLRKIRTQLKAPDRTFSRIVHSRVLETVSNASAKTIARPSAFLGASFGALVGSAVLLYMSKQYGFTYNYSVLIVLFAGGFVLGLIGELLLRLIFRRKSQTHK